MDKGKIFMLVLIGTLLSVALYMFINHQRGNKVTENTPLISPLISRDILFGNPDKANPKISPDGKYISYVAPLDGVLNIWVEETEKAEARPITQDKKRGIRDYFWAYDNQHILYVQDDNGDENWNVFSVNVGTGDIKNLTPLKKVQTTLVNVSPNFPDEIIIGLNDRNPQLPDYYRLNIKTGKRKLILKNDGFMGVDGNGVIFDEKYQPRIGVKQLDDGGVSFEYLDPKNKGKVFATIGLDDAATTIPLGYSNDGEYLYWIDSRGRDTAALVQENVKIGEKKILAESSKSDVQDAWIASKTNTPFAATINYQRRETIYIDPRVSEDIKILQSFIKGDILFVSDTLDGQTWLIGDRQSDHPTDYYIYDRTTKQHRFLFTTSKDLAAVSLQKMHSAVIKSRDGLDMVAYYTLPKSVDPTGSGKAARPVPMVLYVHGGPWARDEWACDKVHQWLANRGYAVLSVNYRGSTGLGKSFLNAGNLEWGAKMQDDLTDAVNWAIQEKIAIADKIVIMGGSYGGYAVLAGLTMTPDVFAGGIDIVGVSNLEILIKSMPPYWKPLMNMFKKRVGNIDTAEGQAFLKSRSPLTHVDNIKKPLLIGQGANDPRVKQAESDQIVKVMKEKGIPVTYVLYADEGHGFIRPENRLSFFAVAEAFLGEILGGQVEPTDGDFKGSSLKILEKDPKLNIVT